MADARVFPPASPNRRLVIFAVELGLLHDSFRMEFPGIPAGDEASWQRRILGEETTWSRILEPLSDLGEHTTIVEGLAIQTGLRADPFTTSDWKVTTLTGQFIRTHDDNPGPSVDWMVGRANSAPGGISTIAMTFGAANGVNRYDDQGRTLVPKHDPREVYSDLFEDSDCDRRPPPATGAPGQKAHLEPWISTIVPIVVDAFRCDRTRVVTLNVGLQNAEELGYSSDIDIRDRFNNRVFASRESDRNAAREAMARYGRFHVEQFARLARALQTVSVNDGTTLLDQTLLVLLSVQGQPGNRRTPWDIVFVGGRALGLDAGRYLHVPRTFALDLPPYGQVNIGGPHNWALVSIARFMGLDIDAVGARQLVLGGGQVVDTTGPVPDL